MRQKRKIAEDKDSSHSQGRMKQSRLDNIYQHGLQKIFEKNLVNWIVDSMSPLSIVESDSFRKMIEDLKVGFTPFSRRTLTRRIKDEFTAVKSSVKNTLSEVAHVSTTADIWSAKTRSFIGVTVHWLDENLARQSAVLACRNFPSPHTFDRIADILNDIHGEFGLDYEKIVSTATDNGSNFVKAFKEFGVSLTVPNQDEDSEESNDEQLEGTDEDDEFDFVPIPEPEGNDDNLILLPKHVRCASHTLSLIATTDVTKIIAATNVSRVHHPALAKCNALWNSAGRPKSAEAIYSVLSLHLKCPVVTRWNSLYDAIKQLLSCEGNLNKVCQLLKMSQFKDSEILYLKEYLRCYSYPNSCGFGLLASRQHTVR